MNFGFHESRHLATFIKCLNIILKNIIWQTILNNFKELNFKTCNLDLGRQYITVSRTIKPQEDLIFWKLTRQFLQTQAWT